MNSSSACLPTFAIGLTEVLLAKKKTILEYLQNREGREPEKARALLLAGLVRINGHVVRSSAERVGETDRVEVREESPYPSRSAAKLLGAFQAFSVSVSGKLCVDLGASHGGFVAVLLEKGAARVVAVDVAYGILDYSLRTDPRVVVKERTNAKEIESSWFDSCEMDWRKGLFFTSDLSFISIKGVLEKISLFLKREGVSAEGVFLVKPQFESSRDTEQGILRDPVLREEIVHSVEEFAEGLGFVVKGRAESPLKGTRGNQEYLLYLSFSARDENPGQEIVSESKP